MTSESVRHSNMRQEVQSQAECLQQTHQETLKNAKNVHFVNQNDHNEETAQKVVKISTQKKDRYSLQNHQEMIFQPNETPKTDTEYHQNE